jgi:hypothetical protein
MNVANMNAALEDLSSDGADDAGDIDLSENTSNAPRSEMDKLDDPEEEMIREWGHQRNVLDAIELKMQFLIWQKYKRRDVFLASCKNYYRDLIAQGALSPAEYKIYYHFSEHYRVPEKNLSADQLKDKKDYNVKRHALIKRMNKMLGKFCDAIFGVELPPPPVGPKVQKTPTKSQKEKAVAVEEKKDEPEHEPETPMDIEASQDSRGPPPTVDVRKYFDEEAVESDAEETHREHEHDNVSALTSPSDASKGKPTLSRLSINDDIAIYYKNDAGQYIKCGMADYHKNPEETWYLGDEASNRFYEVIYNEEKKCFRPKPKRKNWNRTPNYIALYNLEKNAEGKRGMVRIATVDVLESGEYEVIGVPISNFNKIYYVPIKKTWKEAGGSYKEKLKGNGMVKGFCPVKWNHEKKALATYEAPIFTPKVECREIEGVFNEIIETAEEDSGEEDDADIPLPAEAKLFETLPKSLDALFECVPEFLSKFENFWECCDGEGAISGYLMKKGFDVYCSDKYRGNSRMDFLSEEPAFEYDCIITNPPYSGVHLFINRAIELQKPFALLIPIYSLGCKDMRKHGKNYAFKFVACGRHQFRLEDGTLMNPNYGVGWLMYDPEDQEKEKGVHIVYP